MSAHWSWVAHACSEEAAGRQPVRPGSVRVSKGAHVASHYERYSRRGCILIVRPVAQQLGSTGTGCKTCWCSVHLFSCSVICANDITTEDHLDQDWHKPCYKPIIIEQRSLHWSNIIIRTIHHVGLFDLQVHAETPIPRNNSVFPFQHNS